MKLMENNNSKLEEYTTWYSSNKQKCHCPELLPMENTPFPFSVIDFVLSSGFTQSRILVLFSSEKCKYFFFLCTPFLKVLP